MDNEKEGFGKQKKQIQTKFRPFAKSIFFESNLDVKQIKLFQMSPPEIPARRKCAGQSK